MEINIFVEENFNLYNLAMQNTKEITNINKGIISVSFVKVTSSNGYFEGYSYKINGVENRKKTLDEVKAHLNDLGYHLEKSSFNQYEFKNDVLANAYAMKMKDIQEYNDGIKNARKDIRNKTKEFLFGNYEHTYIRYGLIPESGKSYNFRDKRLENGVSVYDAVEVKGKYYIDVVGSIFTYGGLQNKDVFEVSGNMLDTKGSDGEQLLNNVEIVKKINNDSVGLIDDFICEIFG